MVNVDPCLGFHDGCDGWTGLPAVQIVVQGEFDMGSRGIEVNVNDAEVSTHLLEESFLVTEPF